MQEFYFDLGVLEDDGRNLFDEIASKLEAANIRQSPGLSQVKKNEIETNIQEIENQLIDIDDMGHEHSAFIRSETKKLLTVWYEVWRTNIDNEAVTIAFNDNLLILKDTLKIATGTNDLNSIEKLFSNFQTSEPELKKSAKNNLTSLTSLMTAFLSDSFTLKPKVNGIIGNILPFITELNRFDEGFTKNKEVKYDKSWLINIKINGNARDTSFTYFLWTLTEALNSIEDVKMEILNITKGSWIIKIKLWFKGILGKEEVKTVLDKARNSAEAYIEKPSAEVEKLKMEKQKIETEKKKLEKEFESLPDINESHIIRKLNIKKIEAEIEAIKISNSLKKLEGIDKLSQLVRTGFVKVDELQIDINELLFILKSGDNIQIGKSIDDIDNAGEVIE